MERTVACVLVMAMAAEVVPFNLDTLHPVIFQGPITESDVTRGDSYFGYSVGLTKPADGPAWVLVGAPRANSTLGLDDAKEPGALFKCSAERPGCEEVVIDTSRGDRRQGQPPFSYIDKKDGAWIGGALDVDTSPNGKISVCGFRWMNQISKVNHYGNGICYWLEAGAADYNATKVAPLVESSKQMLRRRGMEDAFLYAYGEAGIAVHFANNGSELVMGAPGVYNWKGTVVRLSGEVDINFDSNQRRRRRQADDVFLEPLSVSRIPNPYLSSAVTENDYFGYSVSSGEFLGDGRTYYVAGAPRADFGHGKVFVFDFPPNDLVEISVVFERAGSQVGEYFGGAVLATDLSGDGRPELVVGAPLFSQPAGSSAVPAGLEEGRVCVYQNLGRGQLAEQPLVLTGDRQSRARFGSALAAVGDLDLDGYNDLVVGAPYEQDQRGAIYLYLGSASGLSPTYSQKILASQLSSSLRGFGSSLSHGTDMDDNQYADIAVGSYLSGEAVLLHAQPVLRFHAHLRPSTDKLQPTDKQFTVRACLKYFGRFLPEQIPASVLMRVESRHIVGAFEVAGGLRDNYTYTRVLDFDSYACDDFTVIIKSEVYDFTQPILLSMSYNISGSSTEVAAHSHPVEPVLISTDVTKRAVLRRRRGRQAASGEPLLMGDLSEFCATCPVVNRGAPGQTQVTTSVPFSIGCGADAVCQSDLSVSASVSGLQDGYFTIGASPTIDLDVNVTNVGEPASLPNVQVSLPRPIRLVRVPQLCSERETAQHVLLSCHVRPHPFPPGADGRLRLSLSVEDLAPGMEALTVGLNVTSAGEELAGADNVRNFTLRLRTEADIAVTGQTLEQGDLYYDKQKDRDESEQHDPNYVLVSHRYQVLKYLSSPVDAVNVSFLVPVNVTNSDGRVIRFLDLYKPQATADGRTVTCSIQTGYYLAQDGESYIESPRTWRRSLELTSKQRRLLAAAPQPEVSSNATTVLNCTQPGVACMLLQCPTVAFPRQQSNMVVTLSMRIKLHELEPFMGARDILVLSTIGIAEVGAVPYPLQPENDRPDIYQVHTVLLPSSLQPIPVWVIALAVLGALVLLAAMTYGLYKCGFFKRQRPEVAE